MKYLLSILLISSICLTQEMEVDGDLKVTGTVESTTIDSLKMVIAQLQAQIEVRHGIKLFPESDIFIIPENIYTIFVEIWGSGGGGNSNCNNTLLYRGGGGGAYIRASLQVNPADSLNLIVGPSVYYLQDGISSKIYNGMNLLLTAEGGEVGACGATSSGGTGITHDESIVSIIKNGEGTNNNEGGLAFSGTIQEDSGYGRGSNGTSTSSPSGSGYIFITY